MSIVKVKISPSLTRQLSSIVDVSKDKARVEASNSLVAKLAAATPIDTGEASSGWRVVHYRERSEIINDVPHISNLNAGSSKQAPAYFIEKTILSDGRVTPNGVIVEYKEEPR